MKEMSDTAASIALLLVVAGNGYLESFSLILAYEHVETVREMRAPD